MTRIRPAAYTCAREALENCVEQYIEQGAPNDVVEMVASFIDKLIEDVWREGYESGREDALHGDWI